MEPNFIFINDQYYIQAQAPIVDNRTVILKEGNVFSIADKLGDIRSIANNPSGVYVDGTRFLSKYVLYINGQLPFMLSSALNEENEMHTIDLTNPDMDDTNSEQISKGSLQIQKKIFLWQNTYYSTTKLCNYAIKPLTFKLTWFFDADFKDIFEIRGMKRTLQGTLAPVEVKNSRLVFKYVGADSIKRETCVFFSPNPDLLTTEKAEFNLTLAPKACKNIYISIYFESNDEKTELLTTNRAYLEMISRMTNIKNSGPKINTSNNQFNNWIKRSVSDLMTLTTQVKTGVYPFAGIPWFCTPFGRDGIITAMQTLWIYPELSKYVLKFLAATQAKKLNDLQDAEPGKIFHELRNGEMAQTGEIPFKLYYGSIDTTPLFIMLACMYYERTGDLDFMKEIWPNVKDAVEWIDKYGDADGDGFVEYKRKKKSGLSNQGWKDSFDSIFHTDGALAEAPIALCEVQGYTYAAKLGVAKLFFLFGEKGKAVQLLEQARLLKENFAKAFWSEEKQTYVIALDGNKKQCNISTSNAGHCLFTGIAGLVHAKAIVRTLLNNKLFSGWGIRTVAKSEIRYNPMSYHNGSIWPHDNGIIALGFARYGFIQEAETLASAVYKAALEFESTRLPELFCGFEKVKNVSVTNYPVACTLQAWSSASVYMFIEAFLSIRINAEEKTIYFEKPVLPNSLSEMTISDLPVDSERITLLVKRSSGKITAEIIAAAANSKVKIVLNN